MEELTIEQALKMKAAGWKGQIEASGKGERLLNLALSLHEQLAAAEAKAAMFRESLENLLENATFDTGVHSYGQHGHDEATAAAIQVARTSLALAPEQP